MKLLDIQLYEDDLRKTIRNLDLSVLDGRTVARSTAPFMNKEINSLNAKAGRKLGTV